MAKEPVPQYLRISVNTPSGLTETRELGTGTTGSYNTQINFPSFADTGGYFDPGSTINSANAAVNPPGTFFGRGWLQKPESQGPFLQAAGTVAFLFEFQPGPSGPPGEPDPIWSGVLTAVLNHVDQDGTYIAELGRASVPMTVHPNLATVPVNIAMPETAFAAGDRKYLELHMAATDPETPVQLRAGGIDGSRFISSPAYITEGSGSIAAVSQLTGVGVSADQVSPIVDSGNPILPRVFIDNMMRQ